MDTRKFRFINSYGKVINKRSWSEFKKLFADVQLNRDYRSRITTPISILDCLICLMDYPKAKIAKRSRKLFLASYPSRFRKEKRNKWDFHLTPEEEKLQADYYVHLLTTNDTQIYYRTLKKIEQNPEKYNESLLEALIDPLDAVQKNALEVLKRIDPERYPSNYYELLSLLPDYRKELLYKILKDRLEKNKTLKNSWNQRESFIRSAGALNYKPATALLDEFLHDPDPNCRWTLATSLGYIHTLDSVKHLIMLLMDEDDHIRMTATSSLRKIMPGLYGNMNAQDILLQVGSENPLELFHLMPKTSLNSHTKRAWMRLGYDPEILEHYRNQEIHSIISFYYENNSRTTEESIINSLFLLLKSKMPHTIKILDRLMDAEKNPNLKPQHQQLIQKIEREYAIAKDNGLKIIL